MTQVRDAVRLTIAVTVLMLLGAADPPNGEAQPFCDANGDGVVGVSDGVQVLRAAADLSNSCSLVACDANGDGAITVADGVNVLRAAAALTSSCDAGGAPTPRPTPSGSSAAAVGACDDDCRAARQVCGDGLFFDDFETVEQCTDECVEIVEGYASDVANFDGCVEAQVQFIDCCTRRRQCGVIPDGCGSEFGEAVDACGGAFGGCPLIFFGDDEEE